MKITVVNTKGGASKSTVAFQIASAYMLNKNLDFKHFEVDDENLDAKTFDKSAINRQQITIGNGDGFNDVVRDLYLNNGNFVVDIGGNKTTTMFLESLKKSRMYRKNDLYIIPSSGGSQDIKNMVKTYELIKDMDENANILFALSRVRNIKRINFQYADFFANFKNSNYIVLQDSDVVDLSRKLKKSIYEIVKDEKQKRELEAMFDEALDADDSNSIATFSTMLEIVDEAEDFYKNYIELAFKKLDEITGA